MASKIFDRNKARLKVSQGGKVSKTNAGGFFKARAARDEATRQGIEADEARRKAEDNGAEK